MSSLKVIKSELLHVLKNTQTFAGGVSDGGFFMLEALVDGLRITANNITSGISYLLPVSTLCPFEVGIDAEKLCKAVDSMPDGDLEVINSCPLKLIIKGGGRSKFKIPTEPLKNIIRSPKLAPVEMSKVVTEHYETALKLTTFAASTDREKPHINGVLHSFQTGFELVGTDGPRMSHCRLQQAEGIQVQPDFILPLDFAKRFLTYISREDCDEIRFGVHGDKFIAHVGQAVLWARLKDKKPLDFRKSSALVSPEKHLVLNVAEAKSALRRQMVTASGTTGKSELGSIMVPNGVTLSDWLVKNGIAETRLDNGVNQSVTRMPAPNADDVAFTLSVRYLSEVFKKLVTGKVRLGVAFEPSRVVKITPLDDDDAPVLFDHYIAGLR